ncbi:hypothetical protein DYB32_009202 [Aphanomyces invadans]|uniref:BZIP domain-containing protein n=1 Tax=Aphanomyces invadans TaxID=157072 RepID=A0A3R6V4H6_9STRA|nr:hypothetical protein DYB32_009202 [Aphanomyces invadans]
MPSSPADSSKGSSTCFTPLSNINAWPQSADTPTVIPCVSKKGEKRKQQIREASRRCRIKQKDEVAYLRQRVLEMERVLRDLSSTPKSTNTASEVEISCLRRHNEQLTRALQRTTKQLRFIQTLMHETIQTASSSSTLPQNPESAESLDDTSSKSSAGIQPDQVNSMAGVAATAAASLMSFVVEKGVQVMSISSFDWVGDIWMEGSQVRFAMTKSFSGAFSRKDMADRVWQATQISRCGTPKYTLVTQECVLCIDPSRLRVMRRVESLMEMRVLEHWSVVFRHEIDAHSTLLGSQSVAPLRPVQYTLGKEQQGLLLTTTDDAVHAELRGMYDCVGVPETEVAARVSKDILSVLVLVESALIGAALVAKQRHV